VPLKVTRSPKGKVYSNQHSPRQSDLKSGVKPFHRLKYKINKKLRE